MAQKDRDNPNHPRAVTPPLSQRVGERLPLAQAGFALTEAMRVPIYYPCDRCGTPVGPLADGESVLPGCCPVCGY